MGKIRRLAALSTLDRRLLAIASIRLLMVSLVLRWLGFRWIVTRLPLVQFRDDGVNDLLRAMHYAAWIEAAARCLPFQTRCLSRSIALQWWLAGEGAQSELRIGVAKDGHELKAHAWVELDGAPVNGTTAELTPFTPLKHVGSGMPVARRRLSGLPARRHSRTPVAEHHVTSMGYRR